MSFKLIKRRSFLLWLSVLVFLLGTVVYCGGTYLRLLILTNQAIDMRLQAAAGMVPQLLASDFHDRATRSNSISMKEELRNRVLINELVRLSNLRGAMTVVASGDNFFFSASSVGDAEASQRRSWYYYPYNDIPDALRSVYKEGGERFLEYTNEWGRFYSYCRRLESPGGVPYLVVVDLDAERRAELLRDAWYMPLLSVLWLLIVSAPGILLVFLMRRDLREANISLMEANETLEGQVTLQKDEIESVKDAIERERGELRWVRNLHRQSSAGLVVFNSDGQILDINEAGREILGLEPHGKIEQCVEDFIGTVGWATVQKQMESMTGADMPFVEETSYTRPDGSQRRISVRVGKISAVNESDEDLCYAYLSDITELAVSRNELNYMLYHDEKSGLLNTRGFLETIRQHLKEHNGMAPGVFVLTVNVKRTNAAFGTRVGDEALHEVARRLMAAADIGEVLGRLGGVDFALASYRTSSKEADEIAQRLLAVLDEPFCIGEHKFSLPGNIGVRIPPQSELVDDVVSKATIAAKEAKQRGRGSILSFNNVIRTSNIRNIEIEDWLREELACERRFQIYFQPIVDIATGRIRDVEALVRWLSPAGEWVSPELFIPIAENTGLIEPLSDVLFDVTAKNFLVLRGVLPDVNLSINISAVLFRCGQVASMLEKHLEAQGVNPGDVLLEITETAFIDDMQKCRETLLPLVDKGYSIAIDDFGTGHTSMSYLQKFPIHTLKIDKSFVQYIDQDQKDWSLVQAILRMSEVLKVTVIAEGIENREQERLLREWGCPLGQGYLYHRPIDLKTCLEMFRNTGGQLGHE